MTDAQKKALQDYALVDQVGKALDAMQERFVQDKKRTNDRLLALQTRLAVVGERLLRELMDTFWV